MSKRSQTMTQRGEPLLLWSHGPRASFGSSPPLRSGRRSKHVVHGSGLVAPHRVAHQTATIVNRRLSPLRGLSQPFVARSTSLRRHKTPHQMHLAPPTKTKMNQSTFQRTHGCLHLDKGFLVHLSRMSAADHCLAPQHGRIVMWLPPMGAHR